MKGSKDGKKTARRGRERPVEEPFLFRGRAGETSEGLGGGKRKTRNRRPAPFEKGQGKERRQFAYDNLKGGEEGEGAVQLIPRKTKGAKKGEESLTKKVFRSPARGRGRERESL